MRNFGALFFGFPFTHPSVLDKLSFLPLSTLLGLILILFLIF